MSEKTEEERQSKPLAILIVVILSSIVGLIGTLSGIILGLVLLTPQSLQTSFFEYYTFLAILWLILGPILVYSSYNLWKMRKWAAQAITSIILFDLIAPPIANIIFVQSLSIDVTDALAWALDIATLLFLASVWKKLQ